MGYGDLTAQTFDEIIVSIVVLVVGAVAFGESHRSRRMCHGFTAAAFRLESCDLGCGPAQYRGGHTLLESRIAGLLLGRIGTELANASRAAQQNQIIQEKLQEVDNWLSERRFSKRMRTKIRSYYTEVGPTPFAPWSTLVRDRSTPFGPPECAPQGPLVSSAPSLM